MLVFQMKVNVCRILRVNSSQPYNNGSQAGLNMNNVLAQVINLIKTLFKRTVHDKYSNQTIHLNIHFQGTMLSTFDLQRVSAERAAAVLVLCDKFSLDPSNKLNTHEKF